MLTKRFDAFRYMKSALPDEYFVLSNNQLIFAMTISTTPRINQTVKLGDKTIHRIAMAPLTRMRNVKGQAPDELAVEYVFLIMIDGR